MDPQVDIVEEPLAGRAVEADVLDGDDDRLVVARTGADPALVAEHRGDATADHELGQLGGVELPVGRVSTIRP